MTVRQISYIFILLLWSTAEMQAQTTLSSRQQWVDSVYNRLTLEERIGQLFMVAAYSGGPNYNEPQISKLIANHQIGGVIFMQGGPVRQANLTNQYQKAAQVPLLIAMDAEWGLGMRLDSVVDFPRQMMLGATRDTALMYQVAMAIAYQCRRLGVHINFSPDIDINNNANNPVINSRSFGEQKYWVTEMGRAYMKGLQDNGVMACLKHFPGHGNTNTDSHKDLPLINQSMSELKETELYPFQQLIRDGAQSVMIAHLEVPALEKQAHIPTTLSYNTVTNLLKKELGFEGLVFTDALNMNGVAKYFKPGEVDLKAFLAGNDILLFSQDVPAAIREIKAALQAGKIGEQDFQNRVKKVLSAKHQYQLHQWKPVYTLNLTANLNQYTQPLRKKVAEAAATLVKDEAGLMAVLTKQDKKIQYIGVNVSQSVLQEQLLAKRKNIATQWLRDNNTTTAASDAVLNSMDRYDVNIVAIHGTSFYPAKNYGLSATLLQFLKKAQKNSKVIFVLMGNAYILKNLCDLKTALVMYENDISSNEVAADVLLGNLPSRGFLSVSVCPDIKAPQGSTGSVRGISNPADVVNPTALQKLDRFMQNCVNQAVFPGARILALQKGKIVCDQSYGFLDYQKKNPVTKATMYDLASITKVLSTTLATMKLYEEGKLSLDKRLKDYLPWVIASDKANITIRSLLLHQAGLKSWIPFYKETLDSVTGYPRSDIYRDKPSGDWNIHVAQHLYMRKDYKDTVWKRILDQPLETIGKYIYSDLDFYFLQELVEAVSHQSLPEYVREHFFHPMGLKNICYNPVGKHKIDRIAPTEYDQTFRRQSVHGYVHDPGAAMLGGVAGHAGLFATAWDVAAIFQMLQDKGIYQGKRYLNAATVDRFTAYNSYVSRRGLGFDKPQNSLDDAGPTGNRCSGYTFGHQGFTGTCAWADPANGIVFVFLSNRVCPNADNGAINRLSVRTVAQDYVYEALGIPVNKNRPEVYKTQIQSLR